MRQSLILFAAYLLLGQIEGQTDVIAQLLKEKATDQKFYETGTDKVGGNSATARHAAFLGTKPKALKIAKAYKKKLLTLMSGMEGETAASILAKQAATPSEGCQSDIECDRSAVFRTADGSCNNLDNPDWGQSFTPLRRFLPPAYENGLFTPRQLGVNGDPLRSPREISTVLHTADPDASTQSNVSSHMTMQWGEFLDHDFVLTPLQRGENGSVITCCQDDLTPEAIAAGLNVSDRPQCFPISVPRGDRRFRRTCLNFVRSIQTVNAACNTVPAEQMNTDTAYIDASLIYGSTEEEQAALRTFEEGLLDTSQSDPELLPRSPNPTCATSEPPNFCFAAGDGRVDEQTGLSSMHTIWLREHNRIARGLLKLNPHWKDERVFQETRRIVSALVQKVTYTEFLTVILSFDDLNRFNLRPVNYGRFGSFYDPTVDASVRNAFSTAAYRFGHSLINSVFNNRNRRFSDVGGFRLRDLFGNTSLILSSNGGIINTMTRGFLGDQARVVDRHITPEVTDFLFVDENDNSLDLMSLNVQRGRDHGIPGYNAWRQFCNLSNATNFGGRAGGLVDHPVDVRRALRRLYSSPDDIDLFPGGVTERPVKGGMVGPTFSCILARQFQALKIGDRFFYETDDETVRFTRRQLNEIRKTSLSRIICDNTNTNRIQPKAFMIQGAGNEVVGCSQIDKMDLAPWTERPFSKKWGKYTDHRH